MRQAQARRGDAEFKPGQLFTGQVVTTPNQTPDPDQFVSTAKEPNQGPQSKPYFDGSHRFVLSLDAVLGCEFSKTSLDLRASSRGLLSSAAASAARV